MDQHCAKPRFPNTLDHEMDDENIRVLLAVVESGSIQGAARQLDISRSSLRRRIEGLEAEVGAPLLHRDAGGVRLTAAGGVVVAHGRLLLESSRTMLADARAAAGEAIGVIRAIAPVGMPLNLRVETLLATHGAAPKLRLAVRDVEDPLAHAHEPCELMLYEGPALENGTWFSRVVRREQLRVLASPGYLRARGTPTRASDLADHEILSWKRPRQRADAWPLLAGGTVDVSPWLVSADFLLLHTIASRGGGLLFAVCEPLAAEPQDQTLVPVLEDLIGGELVFRASTPYVAHADSRTHAVMKQIQSFLDGFPASP